MKYFRLPSKKCKYKCQGWPGNILMSISRHPLCECWVPMNNGTIGNEKSEATARTNKDTKYLFCTLWENCDDSEAPVFPSRGNSAIEDFNNNKSIQLLRSTGAVIANFNGLQPFKDGIPPYGGLGGFPNHRSITNDQMPNHTHKVIDKGHSHLTNNSMIECNHLKGNKISLPQSNGDVHIDNIEYSKTGIKLGWEGASKPIDFRQTTLYLTYYVKL